MQIMHIGPFDNEPETAAIMNAYIDENGYESDFSDYRLYHEIYLSHARKTASGKWKSMTRYSIRKT